MSLKFLFFFESLGAQFLFLVHAIKTLVVTPFPWKRLIDQLYQIGVKSLVMTTLSGMFVGGILAIQIYIQIKEYGASGYLGGLATSTTIRNIGPVLIAFMLSGKVGAFTAAELGTMKVTDQLSALECLGGDPFELMIVPRLVAVVVTSCILLFIGLMVGILGGILISGIHFQFSPELYIRHIPRFVSLWSVFVGLIKSILYGLIIGVVSCYHGYHASQGALGVGQAVRKTSVQIVLTIILADFLSSHVFDSLYIYFGLDQGV